MRGLNFFFVRAVRIFRTIARCSKRDFHLGIEIGDPKMFCHKKIRKLSRFFFGNKNVRSGLFKLRKPPLVPDPGQTRGGFLMKVDLGPKKVRPKT